MKNEINLKLSGGKMLSLRSAFLILVLLVSCLFTTAQMKDTTGRNRKNVIRYDLSGGLLFGIDKYIVFGYERVVGKHQSFSINIGRVALPKFISVITDSFNLTQNSKSNGFNISADYRFYLASENKFAPPHGLYIGPYFSFNEFDRDNEWDSRNSNSSTFIKTHSKLTIPAFGAELGYQFVLWKRVALDLMMLGPGLASYKYAVTFDENIDEAKKQQILDALKQVISQKFPGLNYVFSNQEFKANGVIRTWSLGYRFIIHIGFVF
ncbi:MAG: hypothetical protein C5B59_06030 [Bacteroidetes bacterium]|nr:MAG: hypothetical protein C5B59_06030 [Bacteroidota bacterium]